MISKNQLKFLKSLQKKKYRKVHQAFLVEGEKIVEEALLSDWEVQSVWLNPALEKAWQPLLQSKNVAYQTATEKELAQAGTLVSNARALATLSIPTQERVPPQRGTYQLALDGIRDPGNLGTLLRVADWYGIKQLICSLDTVDCYNPKVIAASMGSFLRVNVAYVDLSTYLGDLQDGKIYGALMEGENLHQVSFASEGGLIVLGNESQGIREHLLPSIQQKITIPRFGQAESLNVALAGAIICDNLCRQRSGR